MRVQIPPPPPKFKEKNMNEQLLKSLAAFKEAKLAYRQAGLLLGSLRHTLILDLRDAGLELSDLGIKQE
jgi:hypothetical protein